MKVGIGEGDKRFKGKIILKNASINFEDNKIYYLLAPNGAGKTTVFKLIAGLQILNHGEVRNIYKNNNQLTIFDDLSFYKNLTGYQNISLFTNFKFSSVVVEKIAQKYEILDVLYHKVGKYSLGEGKKLSLILWELLAPRLCIMDEVTNGLDHTSLKTLKDSFNELKKNSIIILTGHDLGFYEKVIDELYVLRKNKFFKEENWKDWGLESIYEKYF